VQALGRALDADLVEIGENPHFDVPLYRHHWTLASDKLSRLTEALRRAAGAIRDRATKNRQAEEKPKRQRLKRMFDKFGVPGVSLLGQTLLPSQITSSAMVGFGANRNVVAIWQVVSIILWGVLFGVLATLGIELALR
jgi:hypothetical protein